MPAGPDCLGIKLFLASALFTGVALGVEPSEPTGLLELRWGHVALEPALSVSQQYNDNVFWNNLNKVASWVTVVSPKLALGFNKGGVSAGITGGARNWTYWEAEKNDFTDRNVNAGIGAQLSGKLSMRTYGAFDYSHYPLGTFFTQGLIPITLEEPDRFRSYTFGSVMNYGSEGARGHLEIPFEFYRIEFLNNLERTAKFDRDDYRFNPRLTARASSKTALLFDALYIRRAYPNGQGETDFSSNIGSALAGVEWKPTGKVATNIQIGYLLNDFDQNYFSDFSGFTWHAEASWHPKQYSTITFQTDRSIYPTQGFGNAILAEDYILQWDYALSSRLSGRVAAAVIQVANQGAGRNDLVINATVGCQYQFREWLNFGLFYSRKTMQSNQDIFNYDQNVVMLTAQVNPVDTSDQFNLLPTIKARSVRY
ncbi:hypothetical protein EWI61_06600 [Methylolobus aquaticus]|nr:hypothetical protein EWI61_06600 [Methylolobus aquaticus]